MHICRRMSGNTSYAYLLQKDRVRERATCRDTSYLKTNYPNSNQIKPLIWAAVKDPAVMIAQV